MSQLIVVYDACVLYPAPLRDLLMSLTQSGLFQARWTEQIHREWMENLLRNSPHLTRERLERTRDKMNAAVRDCLVEDYEPLIETLDLPDADDRHVLAAAIASGASRIVTFNLKDFPLSRLQTYGVVAQHPDEWVSDLLQRDALRVCLAVAQQRARLRDPARTVEELLETFVLQGLPKSVERLSEFRDVL